jgi:demethylspheroidene O-methyltransferase
MSWRERWIAFRNNLISKPEFQRWAAKFPLTRPIARAHSEAAFDLVAGFVYSQVLLACVRLRLFDILGEGPQTTLGLAQRLSLNETATRRLLLAAVSLDLADQIGANLYALGALGAAFRALPSLQKMIEHHVLLYQDLADPVALLRAQNPESQLSQFWSYAANPRAKCELLTNVDGYSALMAESQSIIAAEILGAISLDKYRCLLDVGGGDGAFLIATAPSAQHLTFKLFDLPAVITRARDRLEAAGLTSRTTFYSGSFHCDDLPRGADIITLIRVFHDHNDEEALQLLQRTYNALPAGGTLLIAEPMSGIKGAERVGDAYFGFYFAAMGSGRTRTIQEIKGFLRTAKFTSAEEVPVRVPIITGLVVAKK